MIRRTDQGFNFDASSVVSSNLKNVDLIWRRASAARKGTAFSLIMPSVTPSLQLSYDHFAHSIEYVYADELVRESGFDFVGRRLDEIDIESGDFFESIVRGVVQGNEPAFGWCTFTDIGLHTGEFELGAYPVQIGNGKTIIWVLEDWRGFITENVPGYFQGSLRR